MIVELAIALTLAGEISQYEPCTPPSAQSQTPTVDSQAAVHPLDDKYIQEISMNVGCPYHQYASYLTTCRAEKRQQAWKRMVRENGLFFDKTRMKRFEAISRKYAFL